MTTIDQTEFERIAALTIQANEAVAHELENGGDSHTCVIATMGVFQPEIDKLKAEVERLSKANGQLEAGLDQAVGERDEYNDLLNTFAYTIAPQSVIGEHSSGNDPWQNALDLVTPAAKVDELEAERNAAHHDLRIAVGDGFTTLNSAAFEASRQIAFLRSDVERLTAERDQARRGAQELGKSVVFLAGLIKDAYVRGADDPIDALHMLGNVLAEISEDEDGLSADEFNRVQQALRDRRAAEERAKAERDAAERDEVAAAVRRDVAPTT